MYHDIPPAKRDWWLVVEPDGDTDLCWSDPGFEVDLYVSTDLRTMTAVWMGLTGIAEARGRFEFSGATELAKSMQTWLGLSPFAAQRKLVG